MKVARVNDRWELNLPDHRADRPEWPWWERERLAAMWAHIRRGDVVWDIGAESGDLSALYATWGAQLVLCEPSPKMWPSIRAIWEANDLPLPLAMWPGFMGDPDDGSALVTTGAWPMWADLPLEPEPGFVHLDEQPDDGSGIAVISVDAMVSADIDYPQVLTIDVEGAELQVLKGACGTLATMRPTVFCSVHPQFMWDRYGETSDDLLVYMTHQLGYEAHLLAVDHEQHWMFRPLPGGLA